MYRILLCLKLFLIIPLIETVGEFLDFKRFFHFSNLYFRKFGHQFDVNTMKCKYCGIRTFDKVHISNGTLEELCKLWVDRKISNFTYISALNKFSGRFSFLQGGTSNVCSIKSFGKVMKVVF